MDTKTGLSVQVILLGNVGKAGRATIQPQELRGWGVGGGVLVGRVVSGRASRGVGVLKPKSASDTFHGRQILYKLHCPTQRKQKENPVYERK